MFAPPACCSQRSRALVIASPFDCIAVLECLQNASNMPFASGTSRVMIVEDTTDMTAPVGASIMRLGFGQDTTLTTMDDGRSLQLEVRMGYTTNSATAPSNTFDANYDGASTTVFGPALFQLPKFGPMGIEREGMGETLFSAAIAQIGFWVPFTIVGGVLAGCLAIGRRTAAS